MLFWASTMQQTSPIPLIVDGGWVT